MLCVSEGSQIGNLSNDEPNIDIYVHTFIAPGNRNSPSSRNSPNSSNQHLSSGKQYIIL